MADQNRNTELVARLNELDSQRVKCADAKSKLVEEGYTDTEIANALYSFSYDGVPNDLTLNPTTQKLKLYYTKHPDEAREIATYLLNQQKEEDAKEFAIDMLASQYAPDTQTQSFYELKVADAVGFPYLTTLLLLIPTLVFVLHFHLPSFFMFIPMLLGSLYWLIKKLIND